MTTELFMLLAAIASGVGVELARALLTKKQVVFDQSLKQVQEFRAQIKELQDRQDILEAELTKWKDKYYCLVQELTVVKGERDTMAVDIKRLQGEVATLRAEVDRRTGDK